MLPLHYGLIVNEPDKDIVARIASPLCSVLYVGYKYAVYQEAKTVFTLIRLSSKR